ncbi:MAG: DHH family phosphoesterase [Candidatus Woesearchaeota archaeon]
MGYAITSTEKIKSLEKFLSSVDMGKVCLLYDDDADGLCSAVSFTKMLEEKNISYISYAKFIERKLFSVDFLKELTEQEVTHIVCVDFEPLSWDYITTEQLDTLPFHLCVIDHHAHKTSEYKTDTYQRLCIHPLDITDAPDASQYCCSKFVFDICAQIVDLSDIEWKILPGIIGDMNIIEWGEYVRRIAKTQKVVIGDERDSFFHSPFGQFAHITAFAAKAGIEVFENLCRDYITASTIDEALALGSQFSHAQKTLQHILTHWKEYEETRDSSLSFIHLPNDTGMTSLISSIISYAHPQKTFVFYQLHSDSQAYHCSLRCQETKVHLGELARDVSAHFTGSNGGGHKPAAGLLCQKKDITECFSLLEKLYNERLSLI